MGMPAMNRTGMSALSGPTPVAAMPPKGNAAPKMSGGGKMPHANRGNAKATACPGMAKG